MATRNQRNRFVRFTEFPRMMNPARFAVLFLLATLLYAGLTAGVILLV